MMSSLRGSVLFAFSVSVLSASGEDPLLAASAAKASSVKVAHALADDVLLGLNSTGKIHVAHPLAQHSASELEVDASAATEQHLATLLKNRATVGFASDHQSRANVASRLSESFIFKSSKKKEAKEDEGKKEEDDDDDDDDEGGKKKKTSFEVKAVTQHAQEEEKKKKAVEKKQKQQQEEQQEQILENLEEPEGNKEELKIVDRASKQITSVKQAGNPQTEGDAVEEGAVKKENLEEDAEKAAKMKELHDKADKLEALADKLEGLVKERIGEENKEKEVQKDAEQLAKGSVRNREMMGPLLKGILENKLLKQETRLMKECAEIVDESLPEHAVTFELCQEAEALRQEIVTLLGVMTKHEEEYVDALETAQESIRQATQESIREPSVSQCFTTCKEEEEERKRQEAKQASLDRLRELEASAKELQDKVDRIPRRVKKDGHEDKVLEEWKVIAHYMLEEFHDGVVRFQKVNDAADIDKMHDDLKQKFARIKEYILTFTPQPLGNAGLTFKIQEIVRMIIRRVEMRKEDASALWNEINDLHAQLRKILPDGGFPSIPDLIEWMVKFQGFMVKCSKDPTLLGFREGSEMIPRADQVFTMVDNLKKFAHDFYQEACGLMLLKIETGKNEEAEDGQPVDKDEEGEQQSNLKWDTIEAHIKEVQKHGGLKSQLDDEDFEKLDEVMNEVDQVSPFTTLVKRKLEIYQTFEDEADKAVEDGTKTKDKATAYSAHDLKRKIQELRAHALKLRKEAEKMKMDEHDPDKVAALKAKAAAMENELNKLAEGSDEYQD